MTDSAALRTAFENAGQGHVFAHWDQLDEAARQSLAEQAAFIDLEEVQRLVDTLVKGSGEGAQSLAGLEPAPYIVRPEHGGEKAQWEKAREEGEKVLRAGQVAAFTVAGGQGTRLGYDGPKGTFPVTPVRGLTLFELFAKKIRAAEKRFETTIPWFIMTSPANHGQTVAFFKKKGFCGLSKENVYFFSQGTMPAVDADGKILLEAPDRIALSPDGHGGSLRALVRSGATAAMQERGIEVLSYFQVDNPLVCAIDPAFIGFHRMMDSEMSSKMIPKAYAGEKVGHFCVQDGKTIVVEYSDLPQAMQEETDGHGNLRFLAGSIAIHILSRAFVEKIGKGDDPAMRLPFHKAHKKVPALQPDGTTLKPAEPNGYKFEMFVFDAIPFARNPLVVETLREEEFSPVKNAEGKDSPQSAREDQLRAYARWAIHSGVMVGMADVESGLPAYPFEISPLFAEDEQTFASSWRQLRKKPLLEEGCVLE